MLHAFCSGCPAGSLELLLSPAPYPDHEGMAALCLPSDGVSIGVLFQGMHAAWAVKPSELAQPYFSVAIVAVGLQEECKAVINEGDKIGGSMLLSGYWNTSDNLMFKWVWLFQVLVEHLLGRLEGLAVMSHVDWDWSCRQQLGEAEIG